MKICLTGLKFFFFFTCEKLSFGTKPLINHRISSSCDTRRQSTLCAVFKQTVFTLSGFSICYHKAAKWQNGSTPSWDVLARIQSSGLAWETGWTLVSVQKANNSVCECVCVCARTHDRERGEEIKEYMSTIEHCVFTFKYELNHQQTWTKDTGRFNLTWSWFNWSSVIYIGIFTFVCAYMEHMQFLKWV